MITGPNGTIITSEEWAKDTCYRMTLPADIIASRLSSLGAGVLGASQPSQLDASLTLITAFEAWGVVSNRIQVFLLCPQNADVCNSSKPRSRTAAVGTPELLLETKGMAAESTQSLFLGYTQVV